MVKGKSLIRQLEEFKKAASKRMPIIKMVFFGSRASGKARKESDIDLLVVSPYFKNIPCARGKNLYDYWKLDYPVDFLCFTPEEFKKLKRRVSIVSMALEEGIEIA